MKKEKEIVIENELSIENMSISKSNSSSRKEREVVVKNNLPQNEEEVVDFALTQKKEEMEIMIEPPPKNENINYFQQAKIMKKKKIGKPPMVEMQERIPVKKPAVIIHK